MKLRVICRGKNECSCIPSPSEIVDPATPTQTPPRAVVLQPTPHLPAKIPEWISRESESLLFNPQLYPHLASARPPNPPPTTTTKAPEATDTSRVTSSIGYKTRSGDHR
ncbi:uncharacterized protein CLUP02_01032 [Colletotrichum lupini]|uniref:Uncharacterized protein n=1 Tax=Colletotrichum lupini TaxID=145971 RepID=A0A9Q8SBX4_9PEZI|nr:uncharacterized protein CLUP02_01032 [Colletotrichum lupini]UQC74384.1 hypothetical protein CLUP02_01032 [Colletotrichum lupini]